MKPKEIISLSTDDLIEVEAKAKMGDEEACRIFVAHSVWQKIKAQKRFSTGAKIKVFTAFLTELKVNFQWPQITSS